MIKKAIDLYPFLRRLERKKLASLFYAWGIVLLQKGNTNEARQKFLKAIACQPRKLKATAAYITPALYTMIWNHYRKTTPEIRAGVKWLED